MKRVKLGWYFSEGVHERVLNAAAWISANTSLSVNCGTLVEPIIGAAIAVLEGESEFGVSEKPPRVESIFDAIRSGRSTKTEAVTWYLPRPLRDRVAAEASRRGSTCASLVEAEIVGHIEQLELEFNQGKPFPRRRRRRQ